MKMPSRKKIVEKMAKAIAHTNDYQRWQDFTEEAEAALDALLDMLGINEYIKKGD